MDRDWMPTTQSIERVSGRSQEREFLMQRQGDKISDFGTYSTAETAETKKLGTHVFDISDVLRVSLSHHNYRELVVETRWIETGCPPLSLSNESPAGAGNGNFRCRDRATKSAILALSDRFEVDARHDAMARPVVAPVVDGKVLHSGATASRCVRLPDRRATRQLILPGIAVGFAPAIQEHGALGWRASCYPDPVQSLPHLRVHSDSPRHTRLCLRDEDAIGLPIYVTPVEPHRFAA